jgi:DNA-binding Xre family transcriptional regulator
MNLGQGIRVMLAKRQLSQTKLAMAVNVTRPYMSSLCNNERVPSFGLLESMCAALNCKVWELIRECEE